jgi:hypothetical protein
MLFSARDRDGPTPPATPRGSCVASNRFARLARPITARSPWTGPAPDRMVVTAHNRSRYPPQECRASPPSRDSRDCQPQSIRSRGFFCRTPTRPVDEHCCRRTRLSEPHPSCALTRTAFNNPGPAAACPVSITPGFGSGTMIRCGPALRSGSAATHASQHVGRNQGVVHGRADSADPGGSTSRPVSQSSNRRRTQLSRPDFGTPLSGVRRIRRRKGRRFQPGVIPVCVASNVKSLECPL